MRVYFYPPEFPVSRESNYNPYAKNFINGLRTVCDVVNEKSAKSSILDLFRNLWKVDVVIFNWIENIGNRPLGFIQFFLFLIAFFLLKLRKARIVWVLHNIHPHNGDKAISKIVKSVMFSFSDLIIAHSTDALIYAKSKTIARVVFFHHPFNEFEYLKTNTTCKKDYDLLIWGAIEPYKGILNFLEFYKKNDTHKLKIRVIGKCRDMKYLTQIERVISEGVDYENRKISFDELQGLIQRSSYVLFPYNSNSVSSSGALMDTLSLGGNVIGPEMGAFKDLEKEKLCFVFKSYCDVLQIVESKKTIRLEEINAFAQANNWHLFSCNLVKELALLAEKE
jgi:glycosyltransferase involved in cell wall biosynthesis